MAIHIFCGCTAPRVNDFSFRPFNKNLSTTKVQHLYCGVCKGHKLNGKVYTREEWENWINEPEAIQNINKLLGGET